MKNKVYFVSAIPRTAGNYLLQNISENLNVDWYNTKSHGGVGHLFSKVSLKNSLKIKLDKIFQKNILLTQHLFPTRHNLGILDKCFGLENIEFLVTYRNIFDIALSLLKYKDEGNKYPFSFYPYDEKVNIKNDDFDILQVFLIINLIRLWFDLEKKGKIKNLTFIDYEDISKKTPLLKNKLSKIFNKEFIFNYTFKKSFYSSNKDYRLSETTKKAIKDYAKSFSGVDFSRIGL